MTNCSLKSLFLVFCCIAASVLTSSVRCEEKMDVFGKIEAPESSLKTTRIFVSGRTSPIHPNWAGHFRINNLPKGEFLLRVLGPEHVYDSYVLRVAEHATSEGTRLVCRKFILDQKTGLPGETVHSYVLGIKPLYSTVETRTRQGILQDVLSLLKNPLVLISAVSLGITLVLPMLQESLDAEAMEDITGSVPGGNYASGFLTKIS